MYDVGGGEGITHTQTLRERESFLRFFLLASSISGKNSEFCLLMVACLLSASLSFLFFFSFSSFFFLPPPLPLVFLVVGRVDTGLMVLEWLLLLNIFMLDGSRGAKERRAPSYSSASSSCSQKVPPAAAAAVINSRGPSYLGNERAAAEAEIEAERERELWTMAGRTEIRNPPMTEDKIIATFEAHAAFFEGEVCLYRA